MSFAAWATTIGTPAAMILMVLYYGSGDNPKWLFFKYYKDQIAERDAKHAQEISFRDFQHAQELAFRDKVHEEECLRLNTDITHARNDATEWKNLYINLLKVTSGLVESNVVKGSGV